MRTVRWIGGLGDMATNVSPLGQLEWTDCHLEGMPQDQNTNQHQDKPQTNRSGYSETLRPLQPLWLAQDELWRKGLEEKPYFGWGPLGLMGPSVTASPQVSRWRYQAARLLRQIAFRQLRLLLRCADRLERKESRYRAIQTQDSPNVELTGAEPASSAERPC